MKYRAGFWNSVCVWILVLMLSLDAKQVSKKSAAGASCRPKQLAALTSRLVEDSLTSFDEANGKHLGTWSPGFSQLQVQDNSPPLASKVQCDLHYMAQGLEDILKDQRSNLNPTDVSLHKKLTGTIDHVNMLAKCLKHVLGGDCSTEPNPPVMPTPAFERKQWSHTLLKTARHYLTWLQHWFVPDFPKVKGKNNKDGEVTQAKLHKYLEGGVYVL